jgi:hypothetical protein
MAKGQMNNVQSAANNNAMARQMLLSTGIRNKKKLPVQTSGVGLTSRIKLFNVGVITKLTLDFSAAVTIGVATATASQKAPWNLINRIRVTDYDGTDRVNLSGYQLWVLNSIRKGFPYGLNNEAAAAVFTNPSVPTAVGAQTVSGLIEIPIAFDVDSKVVQLQDLRGALLGQTAVGEAWLTIDWNPTLVSNGNVDALYSGAGTTTVVETTPGSSISATVWQDYILPQALPNGQLPLPMIDLLTVYELNGNQRSNDNIINGAERLFNFPNVRSVIGAYFNIVNNGALASPTDSFRLIANGNNILTEDNLRSQLLRQRLDLNGDLGNLGTHWRLFRDHPIEIALFGNVQFGITPNVALTNPYVEQAWESFYTKGQALPGMGQAQ